VVACYVTCCIFLDISPELVDQTQKEGDTALFTCQATGTPIPSINWYFNGAPVHQTNATKHMISDALLNSITRSSTLTVMNVVSSDIGTYTCEAINVASSDTSSGALTVYGKCFLCMQIYHAIVDQC